MDIVSVAGALSVTRSLSHDCELRLVHLALFHSLRRFRRDLPHTTTVLPREACRLTYEGVYTADTASRVPTVSLLNGGHSFFAYPKLSPRLRIAKSELSIVLTFRSPRGITFVSCNKSNQKCAFWLCAPSAVAMRFSLICCYNS